MSTVPVICSATSLLLMLVLLTAQQSLQAQPERADIELYIGHKRHLTLAGTYLAACTVYVTLYRKSPLGQSCSAGLNPALAMLLQAAASGRPGVFPAVTARAHTPRLSVPAHRLRRCALGHCCARSFGVRGRQPRLRRLAIRQVCSS